MKNSILILLIAVMAVVAITLAMTYGSVPVSSKEELPIADNYIVIGEPIDADHKHGLTQLMVPRIEAKYIVIDDTISVVEITTPKNSFRRLKSLKYSEYEIVTSAEDTLVSESWAIRVLGIEPI